MPVRGWEIFRCGCFQNMAIANQSLNLTHFVRRLVPRWLIGFLVPPNRSTWWVRDQSWMTPRVDWLGARQEKCETKDSSEAGFFAKRGLCFQGQKLNLFRTVGSALEEK